MGILRNSEGFNIVLNVKDDQSFLWELGFLYEKSLNSKYPEYKVKINLASAKWLNAISLCNMLLLVNALIQKNAKCRISVFFFNPDIENLIFHRSAVKDSDYINLFDSFAGKVRFYHKWHFIYEMDAIQKKLRELPDSSLKLDIFPSKSTFLNWASRIKEFVDDNFDQYLHEDAFFDSERCSSTLFPITSLGDGLINSGHRRAVDHRIATLTNILWHHMYEPAKNMSSSDYFKEHENAIKVSTNIMYELVNNVFQHAKGPEGKTIGYTTIQIFRYSLINAHSNRAFPDTELNRPLRKHEIAEVLGIADVNESNENERMRYLGVAIVDAGVGILKSAKEALREGDCKNDYEVMEKVIFTNFTSKIKNSMSLVSSDIDGGYGVSQDREFYFTATDKIPLSPTGFGWPSCILFIASRMGCLNISSDNVSITYRTTKDGFIKLNNILSGYSSTRYEEALDFVSVSSNIFTVIKTRNHRKNVIPGTKIFIEIPVYFKWFPQEEKHKEKHDQLLKSFCL